MTRTSRARLFAATLAAMLAPLASWADAPRILAFGDSLTAGYGLPAGKGRFVARINGDTESTLVLEP